MDSSRVKRPAARRRTGAPAKRPRPGRAKAPPPLARRVAAAGRRALAAAARVGLGLGVFALGACALFDFDLPQPEDFPVHGIDVSYYQEQIDWDAVRRGGVAFAWIKATEGGDHGDRRFHDNFARAAVAGVARGAYHFWYFCRPVADQIAWFIETVPRDDSALPPVLDMEWNHDSPSCRRQPSRAEIHADMTAWLTAVEAHYGKRPVIYTTVDFHRDRLEGVFRDYHIWIRSVAGHPSLRYGERKWHFWQYTATGRVPGIRGNVDRNVFYGTPADFKAFMAGDLPPDA